MLQHLLEGFNNTDPLALLSPDELHQAQKGETEHLIGVAMQELNKPALKKVNKAIMDCPPFSGLRLPSQGLEKSKSFAQQQAAVFKVMPIALLAAGDTEWARPLARVMSGESASTKFLHTVLAGRACTKLTK